MSSHSVVSPIVVGRAGAVSTLASALEGVRRTGDAQFVLVSGPAGMGKSRMVKEAQRLAAELGMARLEGHCTPEAGLPYGAFVSAVRRSTRTMDADELSTVFTGPAALAATLLPEVADALGPAPTPREVDDLFAATWRLLARLVRPHGGVLVLEDLHWADPGTLSLLDYLAHEREGLPLLVLGTYRSDEMHRRHPLALLLADLTRDRRFIPVELSALDAPQVAEMISAIFEGTEVSEAFAVALTARTAGNPFFLEELMKVMVERGDVYRTGSDWESRGLDNIEMPASVRDTLLARARTMDPRSVRIMELASLDRAEIDVEVLQRAADASAEEVDDAIRSGLDLQILTETRESQRRTYAFRHALSREAFADELLGPDRRRAHGSIARAIEAVHADHLDEVAARLADHYEAANDDAAAVEHALRAARYATARMADDEADHRYDQALQLLRAGDPRQIVLLREAVGTNLARVTPMKAAFAQDLRRLAREGADPVSEGLALETISAQLWNEGKGPAALELEREALALVHGRDDHAESWTLARLVRTQALGDSLSPDDPLLEEGVKLAEASGNHRALSSLRGTQMLLELDDDIFDRRYKQALAAAGTGELVEMEGNTHVNYGYICLWRGRFSRALEALRRGDAAYQQFAPADGYTRAGLGWLAALRGDYDDALAIATPWAAARRLPTRVVALSALAEVGLRRGLDDVDETIAVLWEVASQMGEAQRSVPAGAARARKRLNDDGVDAALPLFWAVLDNTVSRNMRGSHWPFAPDLAAALAVEGRAAALGEWAAAVDRVSAIDPNPHNLAAQALVRGHQLSVTGSPDAAAAAFGEAVARYSVMPAPARVVEALLGQTRVLARSGDADAALRAVDRAEDIARSLGANPLLLAAQETRRASASRPVLATLLFTDIVGSTESAVALGDRAWRDRLERHHAIVRRELTRAGGREIDTAGDGFLAAFDAPAAGVRCALAAQAALGEAGIPIRAGLHTGECQEFAGKLTGLTVHIAARVSHLAAAGEVLVTSTVRELIVGSGLRLAHRGEVELKGVPGPWQLFVVDRSGS